MPGRPIEDGLTAAVAGGLLRIVAGSYDEQLVIDQQVTLRAPVGRGQ
jgi:nitrous oxidase accessory protein NosD